MEISCESAGRTIREQQTSGMSKRRKQPRSEFFSVEDLRKEAEEEIDQEAVGAKILNDINSIDFRGIGDLPMEVILCVLIVKFGLAVVCAMSSVISSLSVLPANVRHEVFAMLWPDLLEDDANVLFQSVSKLKLPNVKTDRKFHVFTPPIGHCFHCKSALVRYNKPVKVKVYGLSGTSDGVKVSMQFFQLNAEVIRNCFDNHKPYKLDTLSRVQQCLLRLTKFDSGINFGSSCKLADFFLIILQHR